MKTILVVANETLGGRELIEAVRTRMADDVRFVLCVPQNRPRAGLVIYDDAMFDTAQARVDLALRFVRAEGVDAVGEVGDPDPYTATMDAVREYAPDEIIISTYPEARSGWLRRDLIDRVSEASGVTVEHIVADPDAEGLPFRVTLAVANRTASGEELLEALKEKARGEEKPTRGGDETTRGEEQQEPGRLFLIVIPQEGGDGQATGRARTRLKLVLDRLEAAGLFAAGMIGDPDPYTAIMNALQSFRVDDIVISTFAATKSGWLRGDLIDRVRAASRKPVEHVVHRDAAAAGRT